ncbi:hypothetical protein C8P66_12276 [Humitalea rosea]|uniref:TRAP transporter TAXI family solute receptor n=1 Tax=Humitalea rosea TaxID=990373 RepID=A0A2W7I4F9_9PROT|nr:TAXI family TRAP transporter solute-binding subunit [Humitalea rosea]PZW41089.1 hypothetical protein C8P66_12276 [Humitalea rosea]
MMDRRGLLAAASALIAAPTLVFAQPRNPPWPRALNMGTAAPGGTYALYGPAWGQIAAEMTGINISYRATQGPNQNIILVQRREVELGMVTMGVALQAWNGVGEWTQGNKFRDIRALFPMYDTPFHGIALKRSGITKMSDLNGKSIGVGPRGGTPGTYFPLIMNTLRITPSAIRYGSGSDMTGQLQDGLLDAFLFASGVPIPAFSEAETQGDVAFLDFTAEEIAKLTAAMPELSAGVVEKDTYRTSGRDLSVVGMFNFAIGHKSLPEEVAFAIVEAVMENNSRLVQAISAAKQTLNANATKNSFLPFHPGAARYFRGKGVTIPDSLIQA